MKLSQNEVGQQEIAVVLKSILLLIFAMPIQISIETGKQSA